MVRSCGMWSGWHWVLFNFGLLFEERDRNLGYQDISGSCGSKEKDYIKKNVRKEDMRMNPILRLTQQLFWPFDQNPS